MWTTTQIRAAGQGTNRAGVFGAPARLPTPPLVLRAAAARHHFQTLDFLAHGSIEYGVDQEDQPVRILWSWPTKTPSLRRRWTTSRKPDSASGRPRASCALRV